jgi:uncharacterized membrane protein HdeD (DUF308 family)
MQFDKDLNTCKMFSISCCHQAKINSVRRRNLDNVDIWLLVIGIVSILFGILVIVKPKIIAWVVGIYFIVIGVLWVINAL